MTIVAGEFIAAQSGLVLVAPQPGKIIRVVRVVFTSWGSAGFRLLSDPGGAGEAKLLGTMYSDGGVHDVRLGRAAGPGTARGKALGLTTVFSGPAAEHGVCVWYEVVD